MKPACQIPKEIIDFYAGHRNKKSKLKTCAVLGTKFEIDDKYEILDNSNLNDV